MTKTQLKELAKDDMRTLLENQVSYMSSLFADHDDEEFRYYVDQCHKLARAMLSRIGRSYSPLPCEEDEKEDEPDLSFLDYMASPGAEFDVSERDFYTEDEWKSLFPDSDDL